MALERSDFIVIGADIGSDKFSGDKTDFYDQYARQDEPGKLTFIIDNIYGEYFVVGEVVAASADFYEGFGVKEIKPYDSFESKCERVRKFVRKEFGVEIEPKLLVITNYH